MQDKCTRCGDPRLPIEGETYRFYWPCGCPVIPEGIERIRVPCKKKVADPRYSADPRYVAEDLWLVRDRGFDFQHPTREGAIALWRAALRPYKAPTPPSTASRYETGLASVTAAILANDHVLRERLRLYKLRRWTVANFDFVREVHAHIAAHWRGPLPSPNIIGLGDEDIRLEWYSYASWLWADVHTDEYDVYASFRSNATPTPICVFKPLHLPPNVVTMLVQFQRELERVNLDQPRPQLDNRKILP